MKFIKYNETIYNLDSISYMKKDGDEVRIIPKETAEFRIKDPSRHVWDEIHCFLFFCSTEFLDLEQKEEDGKVIYERNHHEIKPPEHL